MFKKPKERTDVDCPQCNISDVWESELDSADFNCRNCRLHWKVSGEIV